MKISNLTLATTSLSLALALILSSCSPSGSSSSTRSDLSFKYGDQVPPGDLPELTQDYRPKALSPKVFQSDEKTYTPMDLLTEDLSLVFDAQAQTITGHARLVFQTRNTGRPYFQLKGNILNPTLNGVTTAMGTVFDPDRMGNSFYSVEQDIALPMEQILEFDYTLPADRATFVNGGVAFLTDMTDLGEPRYFEMWGPAGFEDDSFQLTMHLKITNSTQKHQVFANGALTQDNSFEWTLNFPSYFTTSSFYVHLTNREFAVNRFAIQGSEKTIPVTVYSGAPSLTQAASDMLPALFQELERDYGAFPHSQFVAYINSSGGGMEYVGATITSTGALAHELFHSWFARGVMPAEGRSGWIDEGLASWRDYNYFQATTLLQRNPTNLSSFSPYRISTPSNCYKDGRNLIAELDLVFAQFGGMKPLLKSFFSRYRYRVVTTEELNEFLNLKTGINVDAYFQRYAFGIGTSADIGVVGPQTDQDRLHPQPLTRQEVLKLR